MTSGGVPLRPLRTMAAGLLHLLVFSAVASGQPCFLRPVDVDISPGPWVPAIADFNEDGRADVVVTLSQFPAYDEIAVLLGTGTGSFGPPTRYTVGINPTDVVVLDFNRDGRLDLVVANANHLGNPPTTPQISLLAGDGSGRFSPAGSVSLGDTKPRDLAVADFNGDGFQDLVVAIFSPSGAAVLLGDGAGGFTLAGVHTAFQNVFAVDVEDFNRDGWIDFALPQDFTADVRVYLGNGAGGFAADIVFRGTASHRRDRPRP